MNVEIQFEREKARRQPGPMNGGSKTNNTANQWFSKPKYLRAICALLCNMSLVFVDFSILLNRWKLEETINKKNKSFEYLKNGFPLQFFLVCISSVMHFNVNNLKGLFVNNKARTP